MEPPPKSEPAAFLFGLPGGMINKTALAKRAKQTATDRE